MDRVEPDYLVISWRSLRESNPSFQIENLILRPRELRGLSVRRWCCCHNLDRGSGVPYLWTMLQLATSASSHPDTRMMAWIPPRSRVSPHARRDARMCPARLVHDCRGAYARSRDRAAWMQDRPTSDANLTLPALRQLPRLSRTASCRGYISLCYNLSARGCRVPILVESGSETTRFSCDGRHYDRGVGGPACHRPEWKFDGAGSRRDRGR
jgi:hypothetical protein